MVDQHATITKYVSILSCYTAYDYQVNISVLRLWFRTVLRLQLKSKLKLQLNWCPHLLLYFDSYWQ
jgi:hypothetical protein